MQTSLKPKEGRRSEPRQRASASRRHFSALGLLSIVLVPLLLVAFAGVLHTDRAAYIGLTVEDGPIEWCTFLFLFLSGTVSTGIALRVAVRKTTDTCAWFFPVFAILCFFASGEEVSWGQRICGFKTPHFFQQHNYQNETSLHNLGPKRLSYLNRIIIGWAMFIYGVCLPLAACNPRMRRLFESSGLALPSVGLTLSFLIGCMMMFDMPTGQDEEVGELFFSLCFLMFMLSEYRRRITGDSEAWRVLIAGPGRRAE